jgi:hypothetical protein
MHYDIMLLDISLTFYSYNYFPKMKTLLSIESLINVYQTMRRHIPDDSCLRSHRRVNHAYHPRLCGEQCQFGLDLNLQGRSNADSTWLGLWRLIRRQKFNGYADCISVLLSWKVTWRLRDIFWNNKIKGNYVLSSQICALTCYNHICE